MPAKGNDSLENLALDDATNPAKRMKVSPANDHSMLQLFVEDPWEKIEIKNLGEWLKSRDVDVDNPAWFLKFTWEFGTADENATKEHLFKVRATRELKNILPFLINCNGDPSFTNEHEQTILHVYLSNVESSYKSDDERLKVSGIVRSLIRKGVSVNAVDERGKTPLHVAVDNDKLEILELMLQSFGNVEARDDEGNTLLHSVIGRTSDVGDAYWNVVRILLGKGADPNGRNAAGMTPVQLAVCKYNADLLQILKDNNGDFGVVTSDNENLLLLAYRRCNFRVPEHVMDEIVDFLVEQGCDVNVRNRFGYTPVHYAVKWDTSLRVLVDLGADVNCQTAIKRKTPLHIAADMNRSECETIPTLFRAGAYGDALDHRGRTALDVALENDDSRTLKCILQFSGNVGNNRTTLNLMSTCKPSTRTSLLDHVDKLREIEMPIDREYSAYLNNRKLWRRYHVRHLEEVRKLMAYTISPGVSLYQFLRMKAKHQFDYANRLPRDLEGKFPGYASIIEAVRVEAVTRHRLMEPARTAWYRATGIDLPVRCVDRITCFLDNWHLKILIDAAAATE